MITKTRSTITKAIDKLPPRYVGVATTYAPDDLEHPKEQFHFYDLTGEWWESRGVNPRKMAQKVMDKRNNADNTNTIAERRSNLMQRLRNKIAMKIKSKYR